MFVGSGKSNETHVKFKSYHYINPTAPAKILQIKWQLPMNSGLDLPTWFTSVQQFQPRAHIDLLHEEWHINGKSRTLELPAYAASDTEELTGSLEKYVELCRPAMQKLMLDQITDELSLATFHEAIRYAHAKNCELIKLALRVRTTALLSAGWGSLTGTETLGIPRVDGANAAYCGDIPTPVPLAHQFDVVFVNAMHSMERRIVEILKTKIFQKKPKPWYEIFLTYFVMLTHLQFIHDQAVGFMKIREQTVSIPYRLSESLLIFQESGNTVSSVVKAMVAKWEYSASNMLYHYRCVLNGDVPFRSAKKNPALLQSRDRLDDEAMAFIADLHRMASEEGKTKALASATALTLQVSTAVQNLTVQLWPSITVGLGRCCKRFADISHSTAIGMP